MRNKTIVASVMALTLLAGGTAFANKGGTQSLEARKAPGVIKLDGDLSEFAGAQGKEIAFLDGKSTVESGVVDSAADFSSKIFALYDDKNLYLGFDVKDDSVQGPATGGDIWKNDTFEIWFDANNDDDTSTECGSEHEDQHQIGVTIATEDEVGKAGHYVWRTQDGADLMDGIKEAGKVLKDGYTLEVAIPITALHGSFKTVKPGQVLGFNLSVVDNDTGDWNHITWSGTQHNNPTMFGSLIIK